MFSRSKRSFEHFCLWGLGISLVAAGGAFLVGFMDMVFPFLATCLLFFLFGVGHSLVEEPPPLWQEKLGDALNSCVWVIDRKGAALYANAKARSLWGTRTPLQTLENKLLYKEENRAGAFLRLRSALLGGLACSVKLPLLADPQKEITEWYRITLTPLAPGFSLMQAEDISAETALEKTLTQETRDMQGFIDHLPVGIYISDSSGTIQRANETLAGWLGMSETALKGQKLYTFLTGNSFPDFSGVWRGRIMLKTPGNEKTPAFSCHLPFDWDGETMIQGVLIRDAAALPEGEETAPAADMVSPAFFSWFFDDAPLGIALFDAHLSLTDANKAMMELFHWDALPNKPIQSFLMEEDAAELEVCMQEVIHRTSATLQCEVRILDEENALAVPRTMAVYVTAMNQSAAGAEEKALGLVLYFMETTDQKKLKNQLNIAQKNETLGRIAGGIAHDFNNILTSIIISTDFLLQKYNVDDPVFEDITKIKQSANRASEIVKKLLSYTRQQQMNPTLIDVNDVLSEFTGSLLTSMCPHIKGRLEFRNEQSRDIGLVKADRAQLRQVIMNLAINACDSMIEKGGMLTLRSRVERFYKPIEINEGEIIPPGDYAVIEVSDTGSGIGKENIARIFEPFFTTKQNMKNSGSGLGLSIVQGIIQQSGGFIKVDSVVDEGTTFTILFPRLPITHKPAEERTPSSSSTVRVKPKTDRRINQLSFAFPEGSLSPQDQDGGQQEDPYAAIAVSKSGRIMLVEDEHDIRFLSKKIFNTIGYEVRDFSSAEEALEALKDDQAFDLVVTDMVMPGMDGKALYAEVKKKIPDVKGILMSGYSEEILQEGLDPEAGLVLVSKPFTSKTMTEKIKEIMG